MKPRQTTLKKFLPQISDSGSDEESVYTPSPQKGVPKIPEQWTRVVNRDRMSHDKILIWDIEKDLADDKVRKVVRARSTIDVGEVLFDPDSWKGKDGELKIDKHKLDEDQLRKYAIMATKVRQKFKAKIGSNEAKGENNKDSEVEESKEQVHNLRRSYSPLGKQKIGQELLQGHEHNTASPKRKRLSLSQVSAAKRVEIVKMAVSKTRTHREIGELFNVRTSVVAQLSSAFKRSKPTIAKRRAQELKRSQEQAAIISVVKELISVRCSIWNVRQVQDLVKEQTGITVSTFKVSSVLKNQFRLSYRKIKRVPVTGNSERNRVMRCLYA